MEKKEKPKTKPIGTGKGGPPPKRGAFPTPKAEIESATPFDPGRGQASSPEAAQPESSEAESPEKEQKEDKGG